MCVRTADTFENCDEVRENKTIRWKCRRPTHILNVFNQYKNLINSKLFECDNYDIQSDYLFGSIKKIKMKYIS